MATEILGADEVTSSQSAKETTVNTAVRQLEGQLVRFISRTTTAQPGSPSAGDVYLLGSSPTGAQWSSQANKIAHYYGGSWKFKTPIEGLRLWVNDENVLVRYDGSDWDILATLPHMPGVAQSSASLSVTASHRGRVIVCDTGSNTVTLNLLAVATAGNGFMFAVKKKAAANSLIIDPNASELVDDATTITLTDDEDSRILFCDGSEWHAIGGGGSGGGGVTLPISDATTLFKNDSDATKTLKFNLGNIATGTERTVNWPNKSGTPAMLDDVAAGGNGSDQLAEDSANHNGLLYAYKAGIVRQDNVLVVVSGGTVLLTEGATNYIEVNASGAVSANTSGFTAGRFPMATATTVAGSPSAIDTVTDKRSWALCIAAAATGDIVRLSDSTLGADAANFDITSISSSYKHLRLVLSGRSTRAASTEDNIRMRFNGDTGSNYDGQARNSQATTTSAAETLGGAYIDWVGIFPAASSPANSGGQCVIDIPNYTGTTFHKTTTSQSSARLTASSGGMRIWAGGGCWRNTAAINQITIFPANGNFLAGTRCTLYGLN